MTLASRSRSLTRLAVVLVTLEGCGMVVGLGDAKQLGDPSQLSPGSSPTGGPQATQVAVGRDHACATLDFGQGSPENGSVRCWGSNSQGQLGSDPSLLMSASTPQDVGFAKSSGFSGASSLALGPGSSCAVSGGYLYCWGGVPAEVPSGIHRFSSVPAYQPSPMDIFSRELSPVTAVALNDTGGCVVEGMSMLCWGLLAFSAGRDAGVDGGAAVSDPGFQSVAVGGSNACAVRTPDGLTAVECWGDDTYGQSGGAVGGSIDAPYGVGLENATEVAAGAGFACALTTNDTGNASVSCWGDNSKGQLGPDGPPGASATPVLIRFSDGLGPSAIALGDDFACAVMTDPNETVECWGDNSKGQLGVGPTGPLESATPLKVQRASDGGSEPLPHVQSIAAGGGTVCVVRFTDPLVSCWGANESGQAGQPKSARVAYATTVAW